MPAPVLGQARHRVCEVAAVEVPRTVLRYLLQGIGQVALLELASFLDAAVDGPGFAARRVDGLHDLEDAGLQRVDLNPCPRRPQGRFQQASRRQTPQVALDRVHSCQGPRGGCGAQADVKFLGGGAEVGMDRVKVDGRSVPARARRLDEEVVDHGGASGRVREQETAAAQGGQHGLGNAGCEMRGDDGVEGVAAFLEDLRCRGSGDRMPARDCAQAGLRRDRRWPS